MNLRKTGAVVALGCALLTGCQELAASIERCNSSLGRGVSQTSDVATLDKKELPNVILGYPIGTPYWEDYRHSSIRKVQYTSEVKLSAIDRMFNEGMITELISLADDYRIGGGKMGMVNGDSFEAESIKAKFRTPEGLEILCARIKKDQWDSKARKFLDRLKLTGDESFFLWLALHPDMYELVTYDDIDSLVGKISSADSLLLVATERKCHKATRMMAAKKLFGHANVTGEQILAVITSFGGVDEETLGKIADEGLKAAKRIGATNVVQALESK